MVWVRGGIGSEEERGNCEGKSPCRKCSATDIQRRQGPGGREETWCLIGSVMLDHVYYIIDGKVYVPMWTSRNI